MHHRPFREIRRQAGLTLIEAVAFLAIFGLVVAGALAMYNSANTSQNKSDLISQVTAVRGLVKELYQGSGSYGAGSLNTVLVSSKRLPATLNTTAPSTISIINGGTMTVTGATTTFNIDLTSVPSEVCVSLLPALSKAGGWTDIRSGATLPGTSLGTTVTPASAINACSPGGATTTALRFTAA